MPRSQRQSVRLPLLAVACVAVVAAGPFAGPVSADFDSGPGARLHEGTELTEATYRGLVEGAAQSLGIQGNPGTFLDLFVNSFVEDPYGIDPGLRLGEFAWTHLASGDFYGVSEYQKVPFIAEIKQLYDCAEFAAVDCCNSVLSWGCGAYGGTYGNGYCTFGGDFTWPEYEENCAKDRFTLVLYAVVIIVQSATECGCMDSPDGLAAFDRIVTNGADVQNLERLVAMALLPDLWVPTLKSAADAFGFTAASAAADGIPVLVPTLTTQVLKIVKGTLWPASDVDSANPPGIPLMTEDQRAPTVPLDIYN